MTQYFKTVLGHRGETLACTYLQKQGYRILERNVRTRLGEIDIVAVHQGTICFIEVRTRHNLDKGHPLESLSFLKRRKLTQLVWWYLKSRGWQERKVRLDAVGILWPAQGKPMVELIQNAFEVSS